MQKIILEALKIRNFCDLQKTIIEDVCKETWKNKKPIPGEQIVIHQAKMLRDMGMINFIESQNGTYYEMTLKGQESFDPFFKKSLRWFMYDTNNLYTILSVLLSLVAIVISVIALKN